MGSDGEDDEEMLLDPDPLTTVAPDGSNPPRDNASSGIQPGTPCGQPGSESSPAITGAEVYKNFVALKRKRSPPKKINEHFQVLKKTPAPVPTRNRFDALDNPIPGTSNQNNASSNANTQEKPPPMYVRGLGHITSKRRRLPEGAAWLHG